VRQAAIGEHRKVESAAVPGHELRHQLLDTVEETLDRRGLVRLGLADRKDAQSVGIAQHAGNHDYAVQMRRQEIVPGLGAPLLECDFGDLVIGQ